MTVSGAPINIEIAEKVSNVVTEGGDVKKQMLEADRRNQAVDPSDPKKVILRNVRGIVKWFSARDHYGFINRHDTEEDIFVHASALVEKGRLRFALEEDQEVEFDVAYGIKGPKAIAVTMPGGLPIESSRYMRSGPRRMLARSRSVSIRGGGGAVLIGDTTDAETNGKTTERPNGRNAKRNGARNAKRNGGGGRRKRTQEDTTDVEVEPQDNNKEREANGDVMGKKNGKPNKNRNRRRRPTVSKSEAGEKNNGGDVKQEVNKGEQDAAEIKTTIEPSGAKTDEPAGGRPKPTKVSEKNAELQKKTVVA